MALGVAQAQLQLVSVLVYPVYILCIIPVPIAAMQRYGVGVKSVRGRYFYLAAAVPIQASCVCEVCKFLKQY